MLKILYSFLEISRKIPVVFSMGSARFGSLSGLYLPAANNLSSLSIVFVERALDGRRWDSDRAQVGCWWELERKSQLCTDAQRTNAQIGSSMLKISVPLQRDSADCRGSGKPTRGKSGQHRAPYFLTGRGPKGLLQVPQKHTASTRGKGENAR